MAVAHDVWTESHTGTTGSTSEASFSWTHGGAGSGVKGVLVSVYDLNVNAVDVTSVTYGGVDVPAVTGGEARDTTGEPGSCKDFFLGTSVPQGTQTVVVNRNNNTNIMYAQASTQTAATDTEPFGPVLLQEDGVLDEQNVDDGSPGSNSLRYVNGYSGLNSAPPVGANTTSLGVIDIGNQVCVGARETTAGQGSRPVGYSTVSSASRAFVHVAIRESSGAVAADPYPYVGGGYYPTQG